MLLNSRSLPLASLFVAALVVAGCGTAPSEPDAGDPSSTPDAAGATPDAADGTTPDAGDATPDAGDESTPDAGDESTPDAGGTVAQTFQARVYNVGPMPVYGGVMIGSTPSVLFNAVPTHHVTEYVEIPVGTASIAFGGPDATVMTGSIPAGTKILIAALAYQQDPQQPPITSARFVVESGPAAADSRHFDFLATVAPLKVAGVGPDGQTQFLLNQGQGAGIDLANTATGFILGASEEDNSFRFSTVRVPAGGRGTIVGAGASYVLIGGPGEQVALETDRKVSVLNLSFGLGEGANFSVSGPFGTMPIATTVPRESNATAWTYIPWPPTSFSASGGSQGGSATYTVTAAEKVSTTTEFFVVGYGGVAGIMLTPRAIQYANNRNLTVTCVEPTLRFRYSILNASNVPLAWQPTGVPGYSEPQQQVFMERGYGEDDRFNLGFGISNPPNAPIGNPEPIFTVVGVVASTTMFLYGSGGSYKLAMVYPDGTLINHIQAD